MMKKIWDVVSEFFGTVRKWVVTRKALTAGEVLDAVFCRLQKQSGGRTVRLTSNLNILVADDSDYHRTRRGFMVYDSFTFCGFGGEIWAIGRGRAKGSYPIDPYWGGDLWGFKMNPWGMSDEECVEEIMNEHRFLRHGFKGTWFIALSDGNLITRKRALEHSLEDLLSHRVQPVRLRKNFGTGWLHLTTLQTYYWMPEVVDYLCQRLQDFVTQENKVASP